jgi:dihydroxyacid dehydratase/phosphogluconate dehydratase
MYKNVSNDILSARRNKWKLPESVINRTDNLGYLSKFRKTVSNASEGCVTY